MTYFYAFWFLLSVVMIVNLILLFRNSRVYKYRTRLLREVGEVSKSEARSLQPWQWRFQALEAVSYREMVFKFWRPLDSFYPDKSFLDPDAKGDY